MINIVKLLLKFEKTSNVEEVKSDLSDSYVKFIHIENEFSKKNHLNLYSIECEGEDYFKSNYKKIENDVKKNIIKNIQYIKDYKEDLIRDGLIYEKFYEIYINKSKCEDYLKINNRFIRWTNKYDKTYYKLIIYLLGVFTLPIIKMIIFYL